MYALSPFQRNRLQHSLVKASKKDAKNEARRLEEEGFSVSEDESKIENK